MSIAWIEVQSWLKNNNVEYSINGEELKRIQIDLTKKDGTGGIERSHTLFAQPSATKKNLGVFNTKDLLEAANVLRIDWP